MQLRPASTLPEGALLDAFTAAFSDYLIGPFRLEPAQWPGFLSRQGVDLSLSRAACDEMGQVLSFALVAPRVVVGGPRWRLATMGARPEARGCGAAPILLDDMEQRAVAAGQTALELEVFAQNERALRLYRSRGFVERHALYGYRAEALGGEAELPRFEPLPRQAALDWLQAQAIEDLPLQVGAQVLAQDPRPWQAWQHEGAQLVFALAPEQLQLLSLVDPHPGQAGALGLVSALRRAHPERALNAPQLQRHDLGGEALEALGLQRQPLHQLLMLKTL